MLGGSGDTPVHEAAFRFLRPRAEARVWAWPVGRAARAGSWQITCSLNWVPGLLWGQRGYWAFTVGIPGSLQDCHMTKGADTQECLWGVGEKDCRWNDL